MGMKARKRGGGRCTVCGILGGHEYAAQKYGWPEDDTHLPRAALSLDLVRNLRPSGSRRLQLMQCPQCDAHFLYRSDYEFLVNGSEDEEFLSRLSPKQVKLWQKAEPDVRSSWPPNPQ